MNNGLHLLLHMLALCGAMGCAAQARTLQAQAPAVRAEGGPEQSASPHPLLISSADHAQSAGAGPMETVATGVRGPGETLTGMAVLPRDRCALIYARAGSTVIDLDLHAFADDGIQFGSDEGPDARPTLLVCAQTHTVRLFLSAKVAQGLGLVSIGLHDVDPTARVRVSDAMGVRNHALKIDTSDQGWPNLDEDITAHLASLSGDWRDVRRVAVPVDARVPTHFDADLAEQQCLSALVLPDDPYLQLELQVKTDQGRVLSQGVEIDGRRSALICNHGRATQLVFEIRPQSGQGFAVVALNVAPRMPLRESAARTVVHLGQPTLDVPKQERLQLLPFDLAFGQVRSISVQSQGCQRYLLTDKTGNASVLGKMRGWSQTGRLLGEAETGSGVPLLLCQSGPVVIEVEADEYSPNARLLVLAAKDAPPLYTTAPLAASRADYRGRLLEPPEVAAAVGSVRSFTMAADQRVALPVVVSKGGCSAFSVGGEDSEGSFDVRLVDPASDQVLTRGHGQTSAGVMLCSTEGREVALEVVRAGAETVALLVQSHWPARN
jgi:hypothetical protein